MEQNNKEDNYLTGQFGFGDPITESSTTKDVNIPENNSDQTKQCLGDYLRQ